MDNKLKYLLALPLVLAGAGLGWLVANIYFRRQMVEVCGIGFIDALLHPSLAVDCLVWRDQAKIWFWPFFLAIVAYLYARARLTPRQPSRRWGK